jgi:hypothetical protein
MMVLLASILAAAPIKIATDFEQTQETNRNIVNRQRQEFFLRPIFDDAPTTPIARRNTVNLAPIRHLPDVPLVGAAHDPMSQAHVCTVLANTAEST